MVSVSVHVILMFDFDAVLTCFICMQVVKEDISVEEEEEDWGLESGAGSDLGDASSGCDHPTMDIPPHSCSNSSLPSSLDPALVSNLLLFSRSHIQSVRAKWIC